jgi:hypothetical protein
MSDENDNEGAPPPEPGPPAEDDNGGSQPKEDQSSAPSPDKEADIAAKSTGNLVPTENPTERQPEGDDKEISEDTQSSETDVDQQKEIDQDEKKSGQTSSEGSGLDGEAATSVPSEGAQQTADPDSIGNSKGAQILMSRFSSWTHTANEGAQTIWKKSVIPENAKTLWKQTPNLASIPRLQKVMGGAAEKAEPVAGKLALSPDAQALSKQSSSLADSTIGDESDEVSSESDDAKGETPTGETDVSSSGEQVDSRIRVGAALSKASTAASVVAESVATGFRGRYSGRAAPETPPARGAEPTKKTSPESQTDIILKSRVGKHMQEILDSLEGHEFAMLLGTGMLGVNLKQCFLKNHGVFVDFLVPGGQAESSGIVRSGDLLIRLGDGDLRKGTILEIPKAIAKARRPVVLILATGTKLAVEKMNYVDVAIAMMHRAREYYNKRGTLSNLPSASPIKGGNGDDLAAVDEIRSVCDTEVLLDNSADCFVTPPVPTLDIRKEFVDEVVLR